MFNCFSNFQLIDLTHYVCAGIPSWDKDLDFREHIKMDYEKGAHVMRYEMDAGIGTHMDAPAHFFRDREYISDINPKTFFVKTCVLDVSKKVAHKDDFMVSENDISEWEYHNGSIESGSLFLVYTGWGKRWPDIIRYRNEDSCGKMHFPGIEANVANILLQREIVGVGIDTLSPDGSDYQFPFHKKILGAGKYLVENIANLDKMPPSGAYAIVLPMKIKNGTEAPVRMFGFVTCNKKL